MSTLDVQRVTGVIELDVPVLTSINAAFNTANSALPNTSGATFAGNLTITGNVTVSSNTISVGGNNISPVQSFRNKIINGNFDYWQRGTSNTSIVNGQYLADRWMHALTDSTANVSSQAFTVGQTDVPNEPTYFHRTIVTSSAGAANRCLLQHRIESVRTLAGQIATLSFWAKADAAKNIAVEFNQQFGTGGSPSSFVSAINVTTCALTTAWKKFTITANIPTISGKTLGTSTDGHFSLLLWFDAGSDYNSRTNSLGQQSGTFDIAQVQLEAGSVATPFELRPQQTELALCQRYYQQCPDYSSAGKRVFNSSGGTADLQVSFDFPVYMRTSPTLVVYGDVNDGSQITLTSTTISRTSGFTKFHSVPNAQHLDFHYYTASAEL